MSQVVMDRGPAADQLNIAAAGVAVNNISLTVTGANGPVLLIATCSFTGGAASEVLEIRIRKAGVAMAHGIARAQPAIASVGMLVAVAVDPDAHVGDVYDVMALGGAGADQDLITNNVQLVLVGLPPTSAISVQSTATA